MTAIEGEVKEGGRIYESFANNAVETGGKFAASVTEINVNIGKNMTTSVVDNAGTIVTSGQQCRRCKLICEYLPRDKKKSKWWSMDGTMGGRGR